MTELLNDVSRQADALGQAFQENKSETHRLQMMQRDLENQWLKEKGEFDELVIQGNGLVAQLCVLEEEKGKMRRNIANLVKDIERATHRYEGIQKDLLDKRAAFQEMRRKMSENIIKMKRHEERVTEAESNTPLLKQIEKIKQEIQALEIKSSELKKCRMEILTNETGVVMTEKQMQLEVVESQQRVTQKRAAHEDKKKQRKSVLDKRRGLEMTSFILTKKNSAMLIRMTKKVQEQKEKHSILLTQRDYLLNLLETTRGKLERFGEGP